MMMLNRMFPTTAFEDMRREMDRVMSSLTRQGNGSSFTAGSYPPVNVCEDGESYFVEAEIPGVDMKDVELQVVGNELSIKGRRDFDDADNMTFHRRERASGAFGRSVTLPTDVNPDKVEAVLKDGVLTVTLPKAESSKAKRISVTSV